ncbi:MAG: hypothetical protein MJZ68_03185 [archaeon]|nr:hypothetical protein [archaeon]
MFDFKPSRNVTIVICVMFVVAMLGSLAIAGDWKTANAPQRGGAQQTNVEIDGMVFSVNGGGATLISIDVVEGTVFTIPEKVPFHGNSLNVTGFRLKAIFVDGDGKTLENTVGQLCGHSFKKTADGYLLTE